MRLIILAIAGIFVLMQFALLLQPAEAASASVSNETEFNTALADAGNDTINITSDFSVSGQITISRNVTINGNGHTLSPTFTKTDNSNNSTIGIQSNDVVINDLVIDGSSGTDLHGINIYISTGILLSNVASINNDRIGILVNGSEATVNNVTTHNNGWSGINVDLGVGVEDPAVLTINGISIHTDFAHIYVDHYFTKDITVNDTNNQYLTIDNPPDPNEYDDDRLYQLDPERFTYEQGNKLKVNICHAKAEAAGGYVTTPVAVDGLNGHGDHEDDIIPPNPDLPEGLNWTRDYVDIWQNDCQDGEVLGDQCEPGPGWAAFVEDYSQGTKKNGGAIDANRSDPEQATGPVDSVDGVLGTFYSLGFEGWIELEFNGYVTNEDGDDLSFHETTWNNPLDYGEETAKVEVSQDGDDWYELSEAISNHNNEGDTGVTLLDFDETGLDWIKYVRITDTTLEANFPNDGNADGYDLDAVDATNVVCEEPEQRPKAKVIAHKIICSDEAYLPNAGATRYLKPITASTAMDWVNASQGNCQFSEDWSFQWTYDSNGYLGGDHYGEAGDEWTTFGPTDDDGMAMTFVDLSNQVGRIEMREILQEGYIPFSDTNNNDVSAEFYCNADAGNYDNWDWITNPESGGTYYCVAWNVPEVQTFMLHADKVICDAEEHLPNWGGGGSAVHSSTAIDWVDQSDGHCAPARQWDFQWAPNTTNPGDHVDYAGDPWTTFSGSIELSLDDLGQGDKIWVREVFDDNFIPFSGTPENDPYSAELYCGNDVLNYDNFDFIQNPQPEEDYYCVGFNVLKPATLSAVKIECVSEGFLPNWGDGSQGPITATTADEFLADVNPAEGDPVCEKVDWQFQWGTPANGDPDDNTGSIGG
ncbi:MAG TPA: right-handed parallel beta-helix repeat-containing protein, partial [Candidatus Saccharimonadales bacterium]